MDAPVRLLQVVVLQSSPMNAGNIRRVSTYGGVDVYVEDEDGSGIESYMGDLLPGMEALDDGYLKMRSVVHPS